MPDEALQTAFEIKTTCDEISRKLLRWHWENKPGEHSLGALLDHIRTRQQESPEYYDRLPDLAGRNSWQQLDTTLCMRVLLDPEKDAARPLDLLGNTEHPAAARRACNAVRTARNEAAHASDRTAAAQAAILFNEAVEALEEGYAGAPLRTSELGQYYRLAEDYLSRCGAKKPIASAAPEEKAPRLIQVQNLRSWNHRILRYLLHQFSERLHGRCLLHQQPENHLHQGKLLRSPLRLHGLS